ncbi:MAG: molecular chaperone TorD family protein, partial [Planctomycetota bacterium]
MTGVAHTYGALARALAPPGGDASAFGALGLRVPDAGVLEAEHVALFGRAGRAVVSPYEGAHRGVGLHALLAAYAAAGFAPDPSFRDRPDHVSVELAFLEGLCRRAERARARRDRETARAAADRSRDFLARHVRRWVPAFFDSLLRTEGFRVHQGLAARATPFLRREGACASAPGGGVGSDAPPAGPSCTTCGSPLGFTPPEREDSRPAWGFVCVRCRLRADLRRFES